MTDEKEKNTQHETISVTLESTMMNEAWELELPVDVPALSIIAKFIREPKLPFRERDDEGNLIPYRLMWREGERYLGETETLQSAQIEAGHTIVMTHEARAGLR
jgi:hypothetical protein